MSLLTRTLRNEPSPGNFNMSTSILKLAAEIELMSSHQSKLFTCLCSGREFQARWLTNCEQLPDWKPSQDVQQEITMIFLAPTDWVSNHFELCCSPEWLGKCWADTSTDSYVSSSWSSIDPGNNSKPSDQQRGAASSGCCVIVVSSSCRRHVIVVVSSSCYRRLYATAVPHCVSIDLRRKQFVLHTIMLCSRDDTFGIFIFHTLLFHTLLCQC